MYPNSTSVPSRLLRNSSRRARYSVFAIGAAPAPRQNKAPRARIGRILSIALSITGFSLPAFLLHRPGTAPLHRPNPAVQSRDLLPHTVVHALEPFHPGARSVDEPEDGGQ